MDGIGGTGAGRLRCRLESRRGCLSGTQVLGRPEFLSATPPIAPEAVRGVAAAVQAVGPSSKQIVQDILEGAVLSADAGKANQLFVQINDLRGVSGLDDHVKQLRALRNETTGGFAGFVYEGKVSRLIKQNDSAVTGAGNLLNMSENQIQTILEGIDSSFAPRPKTLDFLSDNWVGQIKAKVDPAAVFSPGDIASSDPAGYLDTMRDAAMALGRTPVLVTNRPINTNLANMLSSRGIAHRLITE